MCGIIGVFNIKDSEKLVRKGLEIMRHRGKDGYGFYAKDKYALGHCLHAVVGNVKQPLIDRRYDRIFAANCEVYNLKELSSKYKIKVRNDAELFYKLLEREDVNKILSIIDGDYACAYLKNNKLYLFRDLFGVKPVWYAQENDGFAFASEKKVLENMGFNCIFDLNPRNILVYDIKSKKIKFIQREFFYIKPEHNIEYVVMRNETKGLLINAIAKRIPDCKFGLLFSGGVDSAIIALILKQLGVEFTCYICVLEEKEFSKPKDLEYAEAIAKKLNLKLEIIKVKLKDVETNLSKIANIIESSNVTKLGVALPFYFATKKARKDGCKVILSGLGSEEIFAGYERHKDSNDINSECRSGLFWIYERDLYRDDVITMCNNVELRVPFLDKSLADYALKIPAKFKINEHNKLILREIAIELGLDKEYALRKKVAAQYGSNFDKAIDKLARRNKNETKSEYVNKFYNKPNLKLGVLFSGGKDSCYAMQVMARQNYKIECLISMKSKNKDSFMFHTPNIDITKVQAKAMDIPIIFGQTYGDKESELKDLKKTLKKAITKYKIHGIVTGALFSRYQRDRIEKICDELGLKVFSPLWHKNQEAELMEIVKEGFEVIIIKIAADGLDENWLGRKIDEKTITDLRKLCDKNGINVAGEGGEYESLVLNGPMFKKKIIIMDSEKIMIDKYEGIYKIDKTKLIGK